MTFRRYQSQNIKKQMANRRTHKQHIYTHHKIRQKKSKQTNNVLLVVKTQIFKDNCDF